MAKFKLNAGAEIDFLTQAEMDHSLTTAFHDYEAARLSGIKPIRFMDQGTVASNAVTIGDPSTGSTGGFLVGPNEGYVWSIRHLVVEGLTASATTPDIVNIYRANRIIWQLNGNQFAQTWGRGEILFYGSEALAVKNSGNLASTGVIIMHGLAEEVPAELVGKFY